MTISKSCDSLVMSFQKLVTFRPILLVSIQSYFMLVSTHVDYEHFGYDYIDFDPCQFCLGMVQILIINYFGQGIDSPILVFSMDDGITKDPIDSLLGVVTGNLV